MRLFLAVTVVFIVFFLWMPQADLAATHWFYREGEGFPYAWNPWIRGIYVAVPYVSRGVLIAVMLMVAVKFAIFRRWLPSPHFQLPSLRALLFASLLMLLGPGLMVHSVLKDGFARPRPSQISEFGGQEEYAPPFHVGSGEGQSFVSGHAATGFYFAALALILRDRRRRMFGISAGIALGLGIGLLRMVQGAHFLSDILFAGIAVMGVGMGLRWLLYTNFVGKSDV